MKWLILALMLLTPVAAIDVEQDPAGDLQGWTILTAPQSVPARFDAMDLIGLSVEEQPATFLFTWELADLTPDGEAPLTDDSRHIISFQHNGQTYLIILYRAHAEQNYYWGSLVKADFATNRFTFVRPFWNDEIAVDEAANTISVSIDRLDMADPDGAPPLPGRSIDNFWAFTSTRTSEGFIQLGNINGQPLSVGQQQGVFDAMPDVGNSTVAVPVELGLAQSGDARLWSPSPFRASNGEANTFAFDVRLEHSGDEAEIYELRLGQTPSQWDVLIAESIVAMEPGQSRTVPVLVTTPFAHQHGNIQAFQLTAHGVQDTGNIGRLELGIRYHEVPQPAGHHPSLWFHSARFGEEHPLFVVTDNVFTGNSGNLYLNTLEDDDNDQQVPINGNYAGFGCHDGNCAAPASRWTWGAFLQPGLEMGLDFDLESTGTATVSLRTDEPVAQAVVDGTFVYWRYLPHVDFWQRIEAGHLNPTQPFDMLPGQAVDVEFEFTMNEEADLLPFTKNSFFGVILNLTSPRPSLFTGAEAPQLTGGQIDLPIFEYHDPVAPSLLTSQDLLLHVEQTEKMVNPGESVVFDVRLTNNLEREVDLVATLQGSLREWGQIVPERITLAAGQENTIQVAVRAPDDALDEVRADLVIAVEAVHDSGLRSLGRMVAEVDTDDDHADESGRLVATGLSNDAPLGLPIALFAMAGLAWVRRRA